MSFCVFLGVPTSLFFIPIIMISLTFILLNVFSSITVQVTRAIYAFIRVLVGSMSHTIPFQSFSLPNTTPSSHSYFSFPLPISSTIGNASSISATTPSTLATNSPSPHNSSSLVSTPNQSTISSLIFTTSSSKTSTSTSSPVIFEQNHFSPYGDATNVQNDASIVTYAFPSMHIHKEPTSTNVHFMETKFKSEVYKPKMLLSICYSSALLSLTKPTSVQEAFQSVERKQDMELKLDSLCRNNTLLILIPPDHRVIGSKWVLQT